MNIENKSPNKETGSEYLMVKSKKLIKWLIIFYIIIALSCFLIQSKIFPIIICLLQIAIALHLYNKSKGIITIDYNPGSSQPNLFFPLLIPILVLLALAIIEITIIDYAPFWVPFVMYLLLFMLVMVKFINVNETKKKYNSYIVSFILGIAFSFGFTIISNEVFSLKEGEQYNVQVIDKWVNDGKNTTYHFMLLPWGPINDTNYIKVLEYQYNKFQPGDSVTIEYQSGLYGIPFTKLIE